MKKLLIIRHAKSDWENPKQADFDRPLNKRGNLNAPAMAQRLISKSIIPQHIVSSDAVRALATATYFAKIFQINSAEIQKEHAIYEATTATLLNVINGLNNQYNFIALFGHNPGLTNLIQHLHPCDIYNLPTCAMVLLEFPFDSWDLISGDTGKLLMYDYPKSEQE